MSGLFAKIFRHLRRRFVDGPRGLGHPVPAEAFDREYASGWAAEQRNSAEYARLSRLPFGIPDADT